MHTVASRNRYLTAIVLTMGLTAAGSEPAWAQKFVVCQPNSQPTLAADFKTAELVLIAHPIKDWTDAQGENWTEIAIDDVLKSHAALVNVKTITLRRKIEGNQRFLAFADVYKGKVEFYRGVAVSAGNGVKDYLLGAAKVVDGELGERLRYHFYFLGNKDEQIAADAAREWIQTRDTNFAEFARVARTLPAGSVASLLRDPATPDYRQGLFALMLGHCGTAEDGKLLRALTEQAIKKKNVDCNDLLIGQVMLQPQEGWTQVRSILADAKQDFLMRYSALRAAEFIHTWRPDLIVGADRWDIFDPCLRQTDIADVAIDVLRTCKAWDRTSQVLDLYQTTLTKENKHINRSIIHFALKSSDPQAAEFILDQRLRDSRYVEETEEQMRLYESNGNDD